MVTAEGSPVTASAEKNADLFWALRGGGNFGIVTSFLYQAHPVSTVLGGLIEGIASVVRWTTLRPKIQSTTTVH